MKYVYIDSRIQNTERGREREHRMVMHDQIVFRFVYEKCTSKIIRE